jgi:hypothetical protein
MSAKALQRLARLKEDHLPDHDGREAATQKLFEDFLGTSLQAGLTVVGPDNAGYVRVALWHPPAVAVLVARHGDRVVVRKGDDAEVIETGLVYDPVAKTFVPSDPESTDDAVDVLTDRIARLLEERGDKYRQRNKPKVDQDYEEALEEATAPYR